MFAPWAVVPIEPALPNLVYPVPTYNYAPYNYTVCHNNDNDNWQKGYSKGWRNGWTSALERQPPAQCLHPAPPVAPPVENKLPVPWDANGRVRLDDLPARIIKRDAWRYFQSLTPEQRRDALDYCNDKLLPYITSAQQDEWYSGRRADRADQAQNNGGGWNNGWGAAGGCAGHAAGGAWF
jgi:hypothetical protein